MNLIPQNSIYLRAKKRLLEEPSGAGSICGENGPTTLSVGTILESSFNLILNAMVSIIE